MLTESINSISSLWSWDATVFGCACLFFRSLYGLKKNTCFWPPTEYLQYLFIYLSFVLCINWWEQMSIYWSKVEESESNLFNWFNFGEEVKVFVLHRYGHCMRILKKHLVHWRVAKRYMNELSIFESQHRKLLSTTRNSLKRTNSLKIHLRFVFFLWCRNFLQRTLGWLSVRKTSSCHISLDAFVWLSYFYELFVA